MKQAITAYYTREHKLPISKYNVYETRALQLNNSNIDFNTKITNRFSITYVCMYVCMYVNVPDCSSRIYHI